MLAQLTIRNIALIDQLTVSFQRGLNVLTGETGAGKSIVVGSLDFVLGGRADKDRIAGGAERGSVEALFDVTGMGRVLSLLSEMGLEADEGLLPIGREVNQSGRSVCRVAGVMVPLSQLRRVTSVLVDLHGQHAHQSLLDPTTHLFFLDAMGGAPHRALAEETRAAYAVFSEAKKQLAVAEGGALERARREDMLRFQLDELDAANLVEGEEEELEQKRALMRNAEKIREALEKAYAYTSGGLDEETPTALDALRVALSALSSISRYGDAYQAAHDQMAEAVYALESVADDLDTLRDQAEGDPRMLDQIETRLDLLGRLKRKYGASTAAMIAYREQARAELDACEHTEALIESLQKKEKAAKARLDACAEALSKSRRGLAMVCEERVLSQLQDLGMKGARFAVDFDEDAQLSGDGLDKVEFMLSANAGEPLRPLSRVASGGELSRIMLAFKCIEAENEGIPVLVFDEVDTGISGRTGQIVADKMRAIGRARQVLCVTHLPQIAAAADAQYLVEKREQDGRTRTNVVELDVDGRAEALARMLGGGETALAHARTMLER